MKDDKNCRIKRTQLSYRIYVSFKRNEFAAPAVYKRHEERQRIISDEEKENCEERLLRIDE